MNKTNIGIVILNYIAYKETISLTNQFLNLPQNEINLRIIIVDNCSPNYSFVNLEKQYQKSSIVSVVQTPHNIGFANGNNFGYKALRQFMDPDYVIFSNSDIVLKDNDLFKWIINNYEQYHFGILGPSIYSLRTKIHQNPCENWSESIKYNYKLLKRMKWARLKLKLHLLFSPLIKENIPRQQVLVDSVKYKKFTTSKTLHGAFLIMSSLYLKEFEQPFDTGTFLYMEESILKLRCDKKNILMLFSPTYEVNHLQATSTQKVSNSVLKRQLIRRNCEIDSLKRYINILKEEQK